MFSSLCVRSGWVIQAVQGSQREMWHQGPLRWLLLQPQRVGGGVPGGLAGMGLPSALHGAGHVLKGREREAAGPAWDEPCPDWPGTKPVQTGLSAPVCV